MATLLGLFGVVLTVGCEPRAKTTAPSASAGPATMPPAACADARGTCNAYGACWMDPTIMGHEIGGVWQHGGQKWAVGRGGSIIHFDGKTWTPQDSGTEEMLTGVSGTAPTNVYAVSEGGLVLHYDGKRWDVADRVDTGLRAVWATGTHVFAVGVQGVIRHFDGAAWQTDRIDPTKDVFKDLALDHVWGTSERDVWAKGDERTFHYDGKTWKHAEEAVDAPGKPEAVGLADRVDSSRTWRIWGSAPHDVYAIGSFLTHWDGCKWSPVKVPDGYDLTDVWGAGAHDVHAVAHDGRALHYDGTAWTPVKTGVSSPLVRVWAANDKAAFAVGKNGVAIHWDGKTWTKMPSPGDVTFALLSGSSANNLVAWGYSAFGAKKRHVAHRWDGTRWHALDAPDESMSALFVTEREVVFVSSDWMSGKGIIVRYSGGKWVREHLPKVPHSAYPNPVGIWGPSTGHELYIGASDGYAFRHDGKAWKAHRTGIHIKAAAFFGVGDTLFLTGDEGERVTIPRALFTKPVKKPAFDAHPVTAIRPGPEWPAPADCHESCKTEDGQWGLRCGAHGKCRNPCLKGMAILGQYCVNTCKSDKDCYSGDTCNDKGLCEWIPNHGNTGVGCKGGPCEKACPGRLVLVGGTHCGKPCKSDGDCPRGGKGACERGVCGPLCPMGCPYLWGN